MTIQFKNLKGRTLLAMPHLQDPLFERSVCLICQHNSEGTHGFIINKPIHASEKELLEDHHCKINSKKFSNNSLLTGGPMHNDRGFVIHNHGQSWRSTVKVNPSVFITTSNDILDAIAKGEVQKQYFIALGYAAWEPGQLEKEIKDNDWLIGDISPNLLFDTPYEDRWQLALTQLGIVNPAYLIHSEGHA